MLHRCIEIEILDVETAVFSVRLRQGTVDVHFKCDQIACSGCDGVGVVDEVASHHQSGAFFFGLLWVYFTDKTRIGGTAILRHFVVL